ncbi:MULTISPECIES: DUF2759 family protein [Bacillus]|uniref:DUF2759 family protein n=1 Tax=Bacillus TaxID=1386 RepID=UPI0002EA1EEF|nr:MULTISPECIES: DUF2759 family protein [Bacillus]
MGLVVIFAFITLLAVYAVYKTFKEKNVLGLVFAAGTTLMFGAFTIATAIGPLMDKVTVPVAH